MGEQETRFYEFGEFRIDAVKRHLLRYDECVRLSPKVFETLLALVQCSGSILDKEDLIKTVWPDTIVEENNLTQNISAIRKALGENLGDHRYVVTIPGRGYSFVADVRKSPTNGNGNGHVGIAVEPTPEISQDTLQETKVGNAVNAAQTFGEQRYRWFTRRHVFASALVLGCFAAISVWWFIIRAPPQKDATAIRSIAVLPFKSLNAEESEQYIGTGMADALTTKLSNIKLIAVRPTSSVSTSADPTKDPLIRGRELGVDFVIDGHVQRMDDRLRVTVQMTRTSDGAALWAMPFDEKFTNVFAMQDAISERVASTLKIKLSMEEQAGLERRYTENTEAYQAFLKGHYFMNLGTMDGWNKSIEYFQQAVELDPRYALAYAGLADCYRRINERGVPAARSIALARTALAKANEVDDTVAYSHSMVGMIAFRYDWDFVRAEREYKRGRELNPDLAHQWYGFYLLAMNRPGEAEEELRLYKEAQPLLPGAHLGLYFYFTHQYEQAEAEIRSSLELHPDLASLHSLLGLVFEHQRHFTEAETEFRKAMDLSKGDVGSGQLGHLFAVIGRRNDAKRIIDGLNAKVVNGQAWNLFQIAIIYAALDQKDKAIESLEKARDNQELDPVWLRFDPRLDNLRSESRFQAFMLRNGLSL